MWKRLFNTIVVILIGVLLYLGFREFRMFYEAQDKLEEIKEIAVQVPKDEEENTPFNRHIDFNELKSINPDIVGWLYIPGTVIDYPIMVGENDETYLNRDYKGNYSKVGSVFSYADTDLVVDDHVVLFAHNMISGQMFGGLKKYKDSNYAKEHLYAYIYTPDRTKECQLIGTFGCHKTDEVFELESDKDERTVDEWNKFVNSRSSYKLELPELSGQLFTLVTCNGNSETPHRLTVNFSVTKEKYVLE